MPVGSLVLAVVAWAGVSNAGAGSSVPPPPPTPWAQAGARGWTLCLELDKEARSVQAQGQSGSERGMQLRWSQRARQCPHVPSVLALAAESTIMTLQLRTLAAATDDEIAALADEQQRNLRRALHWLDAALSEANLIHRPPPAEARYLRSVALLGLGRLEAADAALASALAQGDLPRWRADRSAAVIALLRGDLATALRRAHRGLRDAPRNDTAELVMSRYVLALVLDRAGAPADSQEHFSSLRRQYRHTQPSSGVEALLPIHERLYLRALFHQSAGNEANARRLWELYLTRPEPQDPERRLVQRHLAELTPVSAIPPPPPESELEASDSDPTSGANPPLPH